MGTHFTAFEMALGMLWPCVVLNEGYLQDTTNPNDNTSPLESCRQIAALHVMPPPSTLRAPCTRMACVLHMIYHAGESFGSLGCSSPHLCLSPPPL